MAGLALIAASAHAVLAADFNWGPGLGTIFTGYGSYTINGLGFTSPVENQGQWGTCWDFSAVAALEAKYKLTRNDTSYSIDLSEEQAPMLIGGTYGDFANGGSDSTVLKQACSGGGIVQASELPYNDYGPYLPPAGDWPLQPGWQNRAVVATSWSTEGGSATAMKAALQTYGPGVNGVDAGTFFYYPDGSDATGVAGVGIDHNVLVVGYHDATSSDDAAIRAAGGYWIVKNSWGTSWSNYGGYGFVPYNLATSADFITGPTYYTGAMATAAWRGNGSVWTAGSNNWISNGSAYRWVNQETAAVFNASSNNSITISGPAIAHSLTINSGAVGYTFSGGSLTVTAGGIFAGESVTINSPLTIGAPQTWTTAAGKTLTVNGSVSTIISTLTVAGAGDTTINAAIGDGGRTLGIGGGLTVSGPGTLALTASNTYSNLTAVNGGTLVLSGSGGAIASSSGITLSAGTFLLDNSAANNPNRIGAAVPLTLQGGELSLVGNAAGTTQAAKNLALQPGDSTISVAANTSPALLNVVSLHRSVGAAALVRGTALGSAASGAVGQIFFSTAPQLSNAGTWAQIGILPYFYGDNNPTGSGTDLVTYDSDGLRLLAPGEYSGTVAAGTNVKLTGSAEVSGSTSILALVLANNGTAPQLTIDDSAALTLASGALLSTGSGGNSISGGSISFGNNAATGSEGIIHAAADLTIGSAITNNAGQAVTLTKSGPAQLTLIGNNTYSGGTHVVGGTLQVAAGGAVIGGGAFSVGGSPAVLTVNGGTVSTSAGGNAFSIGGIAGQTGVVNVSAGNVTSSNAGAAVILGDFGTGIWNQTDGTTAIAGGWTGANSPGSVSQMNFSGGSIQVGGAFLVAQSGSGALNLSGTCTVSTPR
ncbi:MAG: C1 family peptidase, partial [Thermoguttaceae bacterium]